MKKAETQRRRARIRRDFAGFESPPALTRFDNVDPPVWLTVSGCASFMLGLLYLIDGTMLAGFFFLILGAVLASVAHGS